MRRLLICAAAVLLAVATLAALPPAPAAAGTAADYPEYPYPATPAGTAAYDEPLRGQFHFSPLSGWMNDPNGMVYYRGTYHLFFQHNPHGLAWDTMHWGHATSPDMVHWTQRPIALEPGVHAGDLWSGNAVVDTANVTGLKRGDDDPIVMFSGTNGVTVHYSTDGARTFQTFDHGRKVAVPGGISRDPHVFWHAASGRFVMVVWNDAGSDGGGNGASFYTSTNLLDWTYRSRFAAGWFFECPDMFPLAVDGGATKWVLTDASGEYTIGSFDGTAFHSDWASPQRMDLGANDPGGTFYAGQTFTGVPDGRRIQMSWQPGNHGSTWTGDQTFPAELALRTFPEGVRLTRTPIRELSSLRSGGVTYTNRAVDANSPLGVASADTYEVSAEFDVAGATASTFGLKLHTRADGTYDRAVTYDRAAATLYGRPLSAVNGRVRMRVLVDRGQLEVFGNDGRLSVSDNVNFDSAATSQGLQVYSTGGSVTLVSLQFYRLGRSWGTGEATLEGNLAGPWTATGGAWTDVAGGKRGTATGDAFYLSATTFTDGTYEGDVQVVSGTAAALTFRDGYSANVDTSGVVKLWRPGREIATYATPIATGRFYHLKVVAAGPRIQVYLDHRTTPVIDATDTAYTAGRLGLNVFHGTGVVANPTVNGPGLRTNLAGPWHPVGGGWTVPGAGLHASAPGDAFYLSGSTFTNGTYEADVRVVNGVAAALTLRSSADATQHYTANVDTSGVVKLWRPGRDIATYPTAVQEGRTYHLKVVAQGSAFTVYLDGARVIDATDTAYTGGYLGVNAYAGTAAFQNITVS
ncbi:glycoside hydrolase family 32 protein [Dactylosporangium vinaceum]|uniref:GH32 C-terminal domain-containing protein n=1 Tax=Dactylosporangium vinaceum TaxID=53362 RepID=A0ABV5MS39_9ACTN|nr:glycoside hydrolase family 32 protein [Dactylosporangium vinaceum]UAC00549.1 glycoside hydrolase family 32 protein [Dactylosporangium vinaceum]